MPKKYKFLLYLIGFLFCLVIIYLIIRDLSNSISVSKNTDNNQEIASSTSSQLPSYFLIDEADVRQFVENFVILYNSYSYGDYSNLTAVGDYETPDLQQQTMDLVSQLEQNTPAGFSIRTTVDDSTFSYTYPSITKLLVTVSGEAQETNPANPATIQYNVNAKLTLQKSGLHWLVSEIQIQK